MQQSTRIYLYKLYVQHNQNSPISKKAERRIIGEFLFNGFRMVESLNNELVNNKKLSEIIAIKAKWIRSIMFEDVIFPNGKSICLMNRLFFKLIFKYHNTHLLYK